jgi:hypothetical protein
VKVLILLNQCCPKTLHHSHIYSKIINRGFLSSIFIISFLIACAEDPVERTYNNCVAKLNATTTSCSEFPEEERTQCKYLREKEAARICEVVRDTCAIDRDGLDCQTLLSDGFPN